MTLSHRRGQDGRARGKGRCYAGEQTHNPRPSFTARRSSTGRGDRLSVATD